MPRRGLPATPEFRAWFDRKIATLRIRCDEIVASGEQHVPMIFVFEKPQLPHTRGRVGLVPIVLNDIADRERAFAMLHFMAEMDFIEGVIFLVESWIKLTDFPTDKDLMQRSIADDPDREEAIVFTGQQGRMQLIASCRIQRPDNSLGDPVVFDPMAPGNLVHGRMVYDDPTRQ